MPLLVIVQGRFPRELPPTLLAAELLDPRVADQMLLEVTLAQETSPALFTLIITDFRMDDYVSVEEFPGYEPFAALWTLKQPLFQVILKMAFVFLVLLEGFPAFLTFVLRWNRLPGLSARESLHRAADVVLKPFGIWEILLTLVALEFPRPFVKFHVFRELCVITEELIAFLTRVEAAREADLDMLNQCSFLGKRSLTVVALESLDLRVRQNVS